MEYITNIDRTVPDQHFENQDQFEGTSRKHLLLKIYYQHLCIAPLIAKNIKKKWLWNDYTLTKIINSNIFQHGNRNIMYPPII